MHKLCQKILSGYLPPCEELMDSFNSIFTLLNRLESTEQDPGWHAEGNVLIHTEMVLNELYGLFKTEAKSLNNEDRLILILSVLLHDITKPLTTKTKEIKGEMRIVAPGHEYLGGSYISFRLADLELPFNIIYSVIQAVSCHIMPKLLVVKSMADYEYRRLARITRLDLLYYLEKADMKGRICNDQDEQVSHIDLFRLFAQEYQAWPDANQYYKSFETVIMKELSDHSADAKDLVLANAIQRSEKGEIRIVEEEISRSYSYRDSFANLVVLCGFSGSGKSSWSEKYLQGYEHISLDTIRKKITGAEEDQSQNGKVLQEAKKLLKQALAHHKNVVWDATNLRKDFRSQIISLGYAYNSLVTVVLFYDKIDDFIKRNNNRSRVVSSSVLQNQLDKFQWPELTESHRYMIVNNAGEILFKSGYIS